jgi:hypothetical protein
VSEFWDATLEELHHAVIGYAETRGVKPEEDLPLPKDDYDNLIAMVEEEMAREEAEAKAAARAEKAAAKAAAKGKAA